MHNGLSEVMLWNAFVQMSNNDWKCISPDKDNFTIKSKTVLLIISEASQFNSAFCYKVSIRYILAKSWKT